MAVAANLKSNHTQKDRESRKQLTSFMTLSFKWKIEPPQNAAANVRTDSNPKAPCMSCMVDVASNPTPGCRASNWSSH
ncbi:hypothetical protein TNCV_2738931 [Trichonephila clavipes]|nr:hypothetical protein TNCV_2738931 [Trichonephila clavipes]